MKTLLEARGYKAHMAKPTSAKELAGTIIELAKFATKRPGDTGWSKRTIDLMANIAWAIRKNDRKKVKTLVSMIPAGEVEGGLLNQVYAWLDGKIN